MSFTQICFSSCLHVQVKLFTSCMVAIMMISHVLKNAAKYYQSQLNESTLW